MEPLILASASPRRQTLLKLLGVPFTVHAAQVDEAPRPGESPEATARRLSQEKARAVVQTLSAGLVLAADTLVVLDGEILGKPADPAAATAMLQRLRGRAHQVLSAFTLMDAASGREYTEVVATRVWMRDYTAAEVAAYVASGDPMDKAGAYAIQDRDFAPVARLEGCPANVMGLPLCRVDRALRAWQVPLGDTPVQTCRPEAGRCAVAALVRPG
jgi:septum formation protein